MPSHQELELRQELQEGEGGPEPEGKLRELKEFTGTFGMLIFPLSSEPSQISDFFLFERRTRPWLEVIQREGQIKARARTRAGRESRPECPQE